MDTVQIVDLIASLIVAGGVILGFYVGRLTTNKQTKERTREAKRQTVKEKWIATYLLHSFLEQLAAIKKRQHAEDTKHTHLAEKPEDYLWLETQFRTYGHLLGDDLCKEFVSIVKGDTYFMTARKEAGFMPLQKLQDLTASRLKGLEESYKDLTGTDIKSLSE